MLQTWDEMSFLTAESDLWLVHREYQQDLVTAAPSPDHWLQVEWRKWRHFIHFICSSCPLRFKCCIVCVVSALMLFSFNLVTGCLLPSGHNSPRGLFLLRLNLIFNQIKVKKCCWKSKNYILRQSDWSFEKTEVRIVSKNKKRISIQIKRQTRASRLSILDYFITSIYPHLERKMIPSFKNFFDSSHQAQQPETKYL